MSWLPDDYKAPTSGQDFFNPSRIEEGQSAKIRVLGNFKLPKTGVFGWSSWEKTADKNVCHRVEYTAEAKAQLLSKGYDEPKHFWALLCYNWEEMRPQVLEITQKTLQKELIKNFEDEDLGSPQSYDIKIKKTGSGINTKYEVVTLPKSKLPEEVIEQINSSAFNVSNLLTGEEVFGASVTALEKPKLNKLAAPEDDDIPYIFDKEQEE
jgi:hypothetical protein